MKIILAVAFLLGLVLPLTAHGECPEQPASVVARDGELRTCVVEPADRIEIRTTNRGATTIFPGPFPVGEFAGPVLVDGCGSDQVAGRACNAAGCGEWGISVDATFPPCGAPVFDTVP